MSGPFAFVISARQRDDLYELLSAQAEAFEEVAVSCQESAPNVKAHLVSRAARIRQLAALFVVLLLGCAQEHGRTEGLPLYVHLCAAMSPADQEAWGAAAGDLNEARGELALWVGHGPPIGCNAVDVCEGRSNTVGNDGCAVTVRYVAGEAWEVAEGGLSAALEIAQ
jgi:hypothetical protein